MLILRQIHVINVWFCLFDVDYEFYEWYTVDKEGVIMLKKERLVKISQMVNQKGIISINEIMEQLNVSDMTARRDLDESFFFCRS